MCSTDGSVGLEEFVKSSQCIARCNTTTCYSPRLSSQSRWHYRDQSCFTPSRPLAYLLYFALGGPGGSGVDWLLQVGKRMQRLLDGERHYEILSFDPRGIFRSTPNAYCFDNAVQSEIWYDTKAAVGTLDSSEYALKFSWASEKARGQLCASTGNGKYPDGENLRQHVSTASVARDLLAIVKKIDQQRLEAMTESTPRENQVPLDGSAKPIAKLQYFGQSYGTFLGTTFAAMYPEMVGKMVLDANLDAENWQSKWEASIDDHADIRAFFFERCFAGEHDCALYREHDKTPGDIQDRFENLLIALEDSPSCLSGDGRAMPITSSDVLQGFFTTAYQPLFFFKPFAKFTNDLIVGNKPATPFWHRAVPTEDTFSDELLTNTYQGGEVSPAVHCSDGPDLSNEGLDGFRTYLSNLTARFGWASSYQADFKLACWSWSPSLRTKWRFDGPFTASVPILFVNNALDPVTPLKNAHKMAAGFEGSAVLQQDSVGHGSLWPAGDCMWSHVKTYVDTGKLPPPDIICEPRCKPFGEECTDYDGEMEAMMWR
ncbi:uncharacterized protein RCC_04710 [Ramularia collo-cygni]|uniref:Peptidase S33 tripeptidyl aminopeptidase-like C-terminal domain-containing protein n=1 Tax=Ramularia collo-cygni TaxID=112498 RepID=A0A2D3UX22_9PEZI|nr:uncharacterized protein RCC_04710 [Ramularia collo-cygni]CZT18865.1 uncharacterized protein RCC_04710 [Ramularia collo-cygni]